MFANVLFDIIIAAVLIVGAIIGIKNGFLLTIAKPVKFVAAIALAFSLAAPFGNAIISPIIGPAISHKLTDILVEKYSEITAATANQSLPTLIKFAASLCGIDVAGVASGADGISAIEAIAQAVTAPVVNIMSTIFGFIAVYFLSKLLLGLVVFLVNGIISGGVVGKVNKILGCVFTLFLAFVIVWVLTSFTEFILNIPVIASAKWVQGFSGGPLYRFFRSFTPLDLLLSF